MRSLLLSRRGALELIRWWGDGPDRVGEKCGWGHVVADVERWIGGSIGGSDDWRGVGGGELRVKGGGVAARRGMVQSC